MKPYVTLFIGVLAVSFAAIFIRLADAPPLVIATYRLTIASVILIPIASIRARQNLKSLTRLSRHDVLLILLFSVFVALHFVLWITSLSYTSIAILVIMVTSYPASVSVIPSFLLG